MAKADPDNPPLRDDELATMRRIPNPREMRTRVRMTQAPFAAAFALPLGTLRDWEQGVRLPDRATISDLRVIAKNPDTVRAALEEE